VTSRSLVQRKPTECMPLSVTRCNRYCFTPTMSEWKEVRLGKGERKTESSEFFFFFLGGGGGGEAES